MFPVLTGMLALTKVLHASQKSLDSTVLLQSNVLAPDGSPNGMLHRQSIEQYGVDLVLSQHKQASAEVGLPVVDALVDRFEHKQQALASSAAAFKSLLQKVLAGDMSALPTNDTMVAVYALLAEVDADVSQLHANIQDQVTSSSTNVTSVCDTAKDAGFSSGSSGVNDLKSIVDDQRSLHNNCRVAESEVEAHMLSSVADLDQYSQQAGCPTHSCSAGDLLSYADAIAAWLEVHHTTLQAKNATASDSIIAFNEKAEECDKDQAIFEAGYCTYAVKLLSVCEDYSMCVENFQSLANEQHERAKKEEASLKHLFQANNHTKCFVELIEKVLTHTETSAEENVTRLGANIEQADVDKCANSTPDTSHLDIVYTAIPSASPCETGPAELTPGDELWAAQEYGDVSAKNWSLNALAEVVVCHSATPTVTSSAEGPVALYIADFGNNRVQHCTGDVCTVIAGNEDGSDGCEDGALQKPTMLAIKDSSLYIADNTNHRVQRCSIESSQPCETVAGVCQSIRSGNDGFNSAIGVALDSTGSNMFVADRYNNRVQMCPPYATHGQSCSTFAEVKNPLGLVISGDTLFVSGYGDSFVMKCTISTANCESFITKDLKHPAGMAVDVDMKSLYIADAGNSRVLKCGVTDGICSTVAGGSVGAAANQLDWPHGIALDKAENLYIADYHNNRIQYCLAAGGDCSTVVGSNQIAKPMDVVLAH